MRYMWKNVSKIRVSHLKNGIEPIKDVTSKASVLANTKSVLETL